MVLDQMASLSSKYKEFTTRILTFCFQKHHELQRKPTALRSPNNFVKSDKMQRSIQLFLPYHVDSSICSFCRRKFGYKFTVYSSICFLPFVMMFLQPRNNIFQVGNVFIWRSFTRQGQRGWHNERGDPRS